MLTLSRLVVNNFCQHGHREIIFGPGITSIVGPNGSGKTNLLNAIMFALSGAVEGRTKLSLIRLGSGGGDVTLDFSLSQHQFRIYRDFKNSAVLQSLTEDFKVEGIKEVNNWILENLRIDRNTVRHFVIRQGDIDEFLTYSKEGRLQYFLNLVPDLTLFEEIWQSLAGLIEDIPIYNIPVRKHNTESLKKRLVKNKQKLKKAQRIISRINRILERSIKQSDYMKICSEINDIESENLRLNEELSSLRNSLLDCSYKISEYEKKYESEKTISSELVNLKIRINDYYNKLANIEAAKREISNSFISRPMIFVSHNEILEKINLIDGEIQKIRDSLDSSRCNLCGTPLTGDALNEIKCKLDILIKKREELSSELDRLKELETRFGGRSNVIKIRESIKIRINSVRRLLKEISEINIDEIEKQAEFLEEELKKWRNLIETRNCILQKISSNEIMIRKNNEIVSEKQKQLVGKVPILDDRYQYFVDKVSKIKPWISKIEKVCLSLRARIIAYNGINRRRDELIKANRVYSRLRTTLNTIRLQFHRSRLPAMVISRIFDEIIKISNYLLDRFNASFRVERFSDDCEFVLNDRGNIIIDDFLSGGQKITLSLVLHIAKLFLIFNKSNILIVDEPTIYLDDESRNCLCDLLPEIQNVYPDRNFQIIVATHDERLKEISNYVIDLS